LTSNTSGTGNTAVGSYALESNTTGELNTSIGGLALGKNQGGSSNVALGYQALSSNTDGSGNTALGTAALSESTTGTGNTAVGSNALSSNTTGGSNTAVGASALTNAQGSTNVAIGDSALQAATGTGNIALGSRAGAYVSTGSYNIEIGNEAANFQANGDSNTIRIGDPANQTTAYIAGIAGVNIGSGSTVLINSSGQLGTIQSSVRYKQDIHDMFQSSDALMQLRPVTFRYKQPQSDGTKPLQYGLIGEEVAKVYPELVVYGKDGQVESVQYHQLPALLLNEIQKQHWRMEQQELKIAKQEEEIQLLRQQLHEIKTAVAESANRTQVDNTH
jgi:trimeric autotransporter adhesin